MPLATVWNYAILTLRAQAQNVPKKRTPISICNYYTIYARSGRSNPCKHALLRNVAVICRKFLHDLLSLRGKHPPKIDPSATHTRQFVPFHERRERFASMTANIVSLADSKASRMMRQAILHEMHRPPGDADEPAADNLQQVARSLVRKAVQGDVGAIKEVLDRIDGKTLPGASESDDRSPGRT
jgi:hypothetical protein